MTISGLGRGGEGVCQSSLHHWWWTVDGRRWRLKESIILEVVRHQWSVESLRT